MKRLPKETVTAAEAIFELVYALEKAIPELSPALRQGTRVTFDATEAAFIIGAVQADGTSRPLVAIRCDPADRDSFGEVGTPVAMPPSGDPKQWH